LWRSDIVIGLRSKTSFDANNECDGQQETDRQNCLSLNTALCVHHARRAVNVDRKQ